MPLPKPIGRQKEVLYLPAKGHVARLGTAGSGKTTLAILRSAYLADPATNHSGLAVTCVSEINSLARDTLARGNGATPARRLRASRSA